MRSSSSLRGGANGGLKLVRAQQRYRRIACRPVNDKAVTVRAANQRQSGAARMGTALGAAGDMEMRVFIEQRRQPLGDAAGRNVSGSAAQAADTGADAAAWVLRVDDEIIIQLIKYRRSRANGEQAM